MREQLTLLRSAARAVRSSSREQRDRVLGELQETLVKQEAEILAANQEDLRALPASASAAFRDRLALNPDRLAAMRASLQSVAMEPDPLSEETDMRILANGLRVKRVRAPLGVLFLIFESRPNVAIEAFSLALKSGNALILRGGKESCGTVEVLSRLMVQALRAAGLPEGAVWGITDPDRDLVKRLLQEKAFIDVVVPRGGEALIEFVVEHSKIPIIKNDRGLCHVYLHEDAPLAMALRVVENAKCQRPSVCNAMETLLVHSKVAAEVLPRLQESLQRYGVKWHCDARAFALLAGRPGVVAAVPTDFDREFLDFEMSCAVVDSLDEALLHIERHGSKHSEAILTLDRAVAKRFQAEVDAAAVYWNASTRFTDGYELGLGGEIGISTQKLHVRGPVGLKELTSLRWLMEGEGQVRG